MAKKIKPAQEKEISKKELLEDEMLNYYKSLNQQKILPTKEQKRNHFFKSLISLITSLILTLIIFLIIQKYFHSPINLLYLVCIIIFIGIFANAEYLLNKNEERHKFWIGIVVQLLIVFVMFGQLQVSSIQAGISEKQTEILKNSNPTYYPDIRIIPDYKDLTLFAGELSDPRNFDNNRWGRIGLTFYNFGKMDSQHVYCYHQSYNSTFFAFLGDNSKDNNIPNLNASTSLQTELHIRLNNCRLDQKEFCKIESVPLGNQQIILSCQCNGCIQKYFDVPIDFCIYNENRTKECPDYIDYIF